MELRPDLITALPKIQLHWHLEGSVRPQTIFDLAKKHGRTLPDSAGARFYPRQGQPFDVGAFFKYFFLACELIVDQDDWSRTAYETIVDAVRADNLRYGEIFFQPTMHPTADYSTMLAGLRDGARAAEVDTGVRCRFIVAINRGQSVAMAEELVESVITHRCDEVVGIGLDGDGRIGPAENFAKVYELARKNGLHRTAHASPAIDDIETLVDLLKCERIDHGYRIVGQPDLASRLRDENIHFTPCWSLSTYYFGSDIKKNPIRRMRELGLPMSISTDDPELYHTNLSTEYIDCCRSLEWGIDDVIALNAAALDAVWIDNSERIARKIDFDREVKRILEQFGQNND